MAKPQLSQLTSDEQRLLEEIWERIRPSHWFTFTASSPREVGALVDRAGGVLNRLAKQFPGLRYVVIGSDNRGQSSPHLHGFLFLPIELEPFLLETSNAWNWGDVIEVEPLDPEGGAMVYVLRQMVRGEILWFDGHASAAPSNPKKQAGGAGMILSPSKQRRLLLKDLRRIEALDRVNRELRRERDRYRQRVRNAENQLDHEQVDGRIIRKHLSWEDRRAFQHPPIPVTVYFRGERALEIPITLSEEASGAGWPTGQFSTEELLNGLMLGLWDLPTLSIRGYRIGLTPTKVVQWLGLRRPPRRRRDLSVPTHSKPVLTVDFTEPLALELIPESLVVIPPDHPGSCGWLRLEKFTGSIWLFSRRITNPEAAREVARLGVSLQMSDQGIARAIGSRTGGTGDCAVVASNA